MRSAEAARNSRTVETIASWHPPRYLKSKFGIEEHIRRACVRFAIVRLVFFMENGLGMRETIANGTLALPLEASTRLQMIAVDDIGAVAATVDR
jgi:uncharacterized protein YbjT (DUF2867 family)